MKKLINKPADVVEEMLQGLSVLHPGSSAPVGAQGDAPRGCDSKA